MKNTFIIFLLSILAFSCSKNDFEGTKLYLKIDKETYHFNDNFELTILIFPTEEEKTIRFYKNLNNLDISFISKEEELGFNQELKKRFIEGPSLFGDDSEYIDEYIITQEKPFENFFLGTISELENKIVFEIPELKISDKIDKSILLKSSTIIIKGNCRTVHGADSEPFIPKEIKIVME